MRIMAINQRLVLGALIRKAPNRKRNGLSEDYSVLWFTSPMTSTSEEMLI